MEERKQRVTTRVGEVAYAERGEGPAALFVHGVFLNSFYWRHVIERLSGERRCLAPDLLGHGSTPVKQDQDVSLRVQAELLDAFCDAMGLDEVDVVANDSGSAIAQIFAARHPERIRTLTLTNGDADGNYPPPDFRQVVETAKAAHCPVAAHATSKEGMRRAALAGIATIEHGDAGDTEVFRLMVNNHVALCPTLAANEAMKSQRRVVFDERWFDAASPIVPDWDPQGETTARAQRG